MEKKVTEVEVLDVEKRRNPTKHYIYIITVTWDDGTTYNIYRRYSRFFDLQCKLGDMFPLEAGYLNPLERIIPLLPGKILFGRSQIREVAMKRLSLLDEYLKALIKLPNKISACEEVLDFFDVEHEDINPPKQEVKKKTSTAKAHSISGPKLMEHYVAIGRYEKQETGELELQAGDVVEILEKNHSGWWFVQIDEKQGWVPSTYLQPEDGPGDNTTMRAEPGEEERYICTESYEPAGEDEMRLEEGMFVDVVEKNLDGWWLIRYKGEEKWAPATYLMEANVLKIQNKAKQSGVEIVSNLKDISDLLSPGENQRHSQVDLDSALLHQQIKKSRSLQRGGSIRPPPRQNSITHKSPDKSNSLPKKTYQTLADFEDSVGDGISFHQGETVNVLEKSDSGWWYVEIGGKDGWAPSTYIGETKSIETVEETYNEISSPDNSDDDDWEEIDYSTVNKNTSSDNVYSEIKSISNEASPKLPSKVPVSKKNSHIIDRSQLAPPPKIPQIISTSSTHSNDQTQAPMANPMASVLADVLKSRNERKNSPPPPPDKKTMLSHNSSVDKPALPPNKNKPQLFHSNPSFDKNLKSETSNKPPPPPNVNKPQLNKNRLFDNVTTSESSNKPPPPPNINKPQLSNNPSFDKATKSVSSNKPPPPPNLNKPQLNKNRSFDKVTIPESNNKPPPPPNISKPQSRQNSDMCEKSEVDRSSGEIPRAGIASALKSRFENTQKSSTDCNSPQRAKSPLGLPAGNSSSLKSKLEQRQKKIEPTHSTNVSRPQSKPKGQMPSKPSVVKTNTGHTSVTPHQFIPKPLTPISKSSSHSKPDSNPVREWETNSEFPKSNITSSLKSKFEAGFGNTKSSPDPSSKPAFKPTSAITPKPVLFRKDIKETPPSQKSETSSDRPYSRIDETQRPRKGSAASLKAMFECSETKPVSKAPDLVSKPGPLKKTFLGQDTNKAKSVEKTLPQKNKKWSPPQQKENKVNGSNVNFSNIANTLKSKLDFGGGVTPPAPGKMETSDTPKTVTKPTIVIHDSGEPGQYVTVADFVSDDADGLSFQAGQEVTVIEKAEGWWWVCIGQKEGWAPETYLEPSGTQNGESLNVTYRAACDFEGENDGELALTEGTDIEVIEKSDQWWFVRTGHGEGWVPGNYIEQI